MILHLDEAHKLAQELSDHKKELKSAMFSNNKLASFSVFPSPSLGELTFTHIQLPFAKAYFASTELQTVERGRYDFLLPLENGERIVAFNSFHERFRLPEDERDDERFKGLTEMSCFDRLGRLMSATSMSNNLVQYDLMQDVAQCGPSEFVVCLSHAPDSPKLSVYNSNLTRLRHVDCKSFLNICCNSKFVFGLLYSDDDDDGDNNEQDKRSSVPRILVHHLDTLSEAFELRVPRKYRVERIFADEHHLLAVCATKSELESNQLFMSVFDLATCNVIGGDNSANDVRFSLTESPFELNMGDRWAEELLMIDGWLVVLSGDELL